MKKNVLKSLVLYFALAALLEFSFQNCGPAKLSTSDPNSLSVSFAVGTSINMTNLLNSPQESAANVLYPNPLSASTVEYDLNTPIIENVVLKNNDFSQIIWVDPSSSVVATGDTLSLTNFTMNSAGMYYVVGFRNQSPYMIAAFKLVQRNSTPMAISDSSAFLLNESTAYTDGTYEYDLVEMEAPYVDLNFIQFSFGNNVAIGKRAILVKKILTQSMSVQLYMTDTSGLSVTQTLTLPAQAAPTPTPSSTPLPTPVPTPTPAPTPAPTPVVEVCANAPENGTAAVSCPAGEVITQITFASYGTATGACGTYALSSCNASNSMSLVQAACLGQPSCSVDSNNGVFGDPCPGSGKSLNIEVTCGSQ